MPPIPRIIRQEDVSLESSVGPRADASIFGADIGAGLAATGQGLAAVSRRLKADRDAEIMQDARTQFLEVKLQYKKEQRDKELNTVGDIPGWNEDIKSRYLKDVQARANTIRSKEARQWFATEANAFQYEVDSDSYVLERTRFKEGYADKTFTQMDAENSTILTGLDPEEFSKLIANHKAKQADLDGVAVNPAYSKPRIEKKIAEAAQAQITQESMDYGVDYAIERIESGAYNEMLPVDFLSQKVQQLKSQNKTQNVAQQNDLAKILDKDVAEIAKSGPTAASPNSEAMIRGTYGDTDQTIKTIIDHRKRVEGATAQWKFTNNYFNDPSSAGKVQEDLKKWAEGTPDYGTRADGTKKGTGFLGELKRPDGSVSTELSIGVEMDGKEVEIPTLVPTLTKDEVQSLLNGEKPSRQIVEKATVHAKQRMAKGLSPFANNGTDELSVIERQHYANQISEALVAADKALRDDSVAFFNNPDAYPENAEARKEWDADPLNVAKRERYFSLIDAWQERVGLSPSQRNVMSESEAKEEVAKQISIMHEQPGQMGEYFKNMAKKYGDGKYQRAMTDLRYAGMDGRLEFIAADPNNPFVGHLVESLKVKDEDLKGLVDTPEKQAALQAAVLADDNFQAYMMDQNPDFKEGDITNFMVRAKNAVEHYALFLMSRPGSQVKDYATAVDMTMKRFGPAYVDPSGEFTIPKDVPKEHWDDISDTTEQLKYVYGELAMTNPEIQSIVSDFLPAGASPQAKGEAARNLIINHLKWKSAGDGKGLQPWIDMGDGRWLQLRDKTGKRVYHTFNQLAAPVEHQYLMNEFVPGGVKAPKEIEMPADLGMTNYPGL